MGETASGKTDLAENIARELGAQLINADTFQSYRGMDIGTAKPENKDEYKLVDIKDPQEQFGVGEWVRLAANELTALFREKRSAVIVGGSGLNIRALFEGYSEMAGPPDPDLRAELNQTLQEKGLAALVDQLTKEDPEAATKVDLNNPVRVTRAIERARGSKESISVAIPPYRKVKFAVQRPVEETNARIQDRTTEMIRNGWLEEVEVLRQRGYGPNAPGFKAHGYRELWRVLENQLGLDEAVESIVSQVKHYAKRQRTWLRTEPDLKVLESIGETSPAKRAVAHLFAIGEGAVENGQDH
jgi:tRNA dimethylallyltransferase